MALRAGAFPEKLGHSACSQPACAGKDWCITHPIGQRCTDDQPTIKGRTSANFGYSKPLFACVHRTFRRSIHCAGACNFFWTKRRSRGQREDYLLKALRAYKDNSRRGYDAQMSEVVYPMKNEDFVDLAYFLARTK